MSLDKMSAQSFPPPTLEEWQEKAESSLKGRTIDSLEKETIENIKLKPLYTKNDEGEPSQFPAQSDFRRGSQPLGYISQDWKVAQQLLIKTDDVAETLRKAIAKGQTAIAFEVNESNITQLNQLQDFHGHYPYAINAKELQHDFIEKISAFKGEATGYIGKDPIALLAEKGAEVDETSRAYNELYEITSASEPKLRTILVDTTPYHNGGANAVFELAIAISTGVFHVEELTSRGFAPKDVFEKMVFQFSIGANFFMELAKLRAARILWTTIGEAYGVEEKSRGMVISARTSHFTKTLYDPYVNMLRAGNEAFAAVLGGIGYLHVSPFNEPEESPTEFAERIARNTQLILKEEAHITKTIDPAGGSWYVEELTRKLVEKAWSLFLEIDEKGGILEGLKSGWLQGEIAATMAKRQAEVATRKQTIVGTNKYVDLKGDALTPTSRQTVKRTGFIEPIPKLRIAAAFEELREKAAQMREPSVGLITLGKLKSHKARADFITGFLAPGGIHTVSSGEITSPEEALPFVKETGLTHYCLCGSDEQYEDFGQQVLKLVKEAAPSSKFYLAGLPKEKDKWRMSGLEDFIHLKSNCYETLANFLADMEVKENDEAQF